MKQQVLIRSFFSPCRPAKRHGKGRMNSIVFHPKIATIIDELRATRWQKGLTARLLALGTAFESKARSVA